MEDVVEFMGDQPRLITPGLIGYEGPLLHPVESSPHPDPPLLLIGLSHPVPQHRIQLGINDLIFTHHMHSFQVQDFLMLLLLDGAVLLMLLIDLLRHIL